MNLCEQMIQFSFEGHLKVLEGKMNCRLFRHLNTVSATSDETVPCVENSLLTVVSVCRRALSVVNTKTRRDAATGARQPVKQSFV